MHSSGGLRPLDTHDQGTLTNAGISIPEVARSASLEVSRRLRDSALRADLNHRGALISASLAGLSEATGASPPVLSGSPPRGDSAVRHCCRGVRGASTIRGEPQLAFVLGAGLWAEVALLHPTCGVVGEGDLVANSNGVWRRTFTGHHDGALAHQSQCWAPGRGSAFSYQRGVAARAGVHVAFGVRVIGLTSLRCGRTFGGRVPGRGPRPGAGR